MCAQAHVKCRSPSAEMQSHAKGNKNRFTWGFEGGINVSVWKLITCSGELWLNITKTQLTHRLVPLNPHYTSTISQCLAGRMRKRRENFYKR